MNKLLLLLLLVSHVCIGQREDLVKRFIRTSCYLKGTGQLHLNYTLTVTEKDGLSDSIKMDFFKCIKGQRVVMGNAQELLKKESSVLILNHVTKHIAIFEDTTSNDLSEIITAEMRMYIDSASNVSKQDNKDVETFILNYHSPYIPYSTVEIIFSKKTGNLRKIKANFNSQYPASYSSTTTTYHQWDTTWLPEAEFPDFERYLSTTSNGYEVSNEWKEYEFFKPQKGTLKF